MSVMQVIGLLGSFWIMIVLTILLTYVVTKDKVPTVIKEIKNITRDKEEINKVEIITEEMESDMEEGVMNDYYGRF